MSFTVAHRSKDKVQDGKSLTLTKSSYPRNSSLIRASCGSILHSQLTIGNQAAQRLDRTSNVVGFDFAKIGIQHKLKVTQPSDPYELEADRVAEQVMKMQLANAATLSMTKKEEAMERKCAACEMNEQDEDERQLNISRKLSSATSSLEASDDEVAVEEIDNIRSSSDGSSLDPWTKEFMEAHFGYDFRDVRIHTDEKARASAQSVNALAYTIGNDIVFAQGQYQPSTEDGKKLLAHELTHVIQQQNKISPSIQRRMTMDEDTIEKWRLDELKSIERELNTIDLTLFPLYEGMEPDVETLGTIAKRRIKKGDIALPIERFDDILPMLEWLQEKLRGTQIAAEGFVRELHLMGHGGTEKFQFGGYYYKTEDLYDYGSGLFSTFMAPGGTIYMEGCNIAAGDAGIRYLSEIGRIFFGNDGFGFIRGNTCEVRSIVGVELQECDPRTFNWPGDFP